MFGSVYIYSVVADNFLLYVHIFLSKYIRLQMCLCVLFQRLLCVYELVSVYVFVYCYAHHTDKQTSPCGSMHAATEEMFSKAV